MKNPVCTHRPGSECKRLVLTTIESNFQIGTGQTQIYTGLICQVDPAKQVLKTNVGTEIIDSRVGF